jgi:hypothetical protein
MSEPPTTRRGRARLILGAGATLLALAGVVAIAARSPDGGQRTYHRLHLAALVTQDCDEALFDVVLPDGVRLLPSLPGSLGTESRLTWQAPLRAGVSELELPLVAQRRRGEVQVQLRVGEQRVQGAVTLAAPAPSVAAADGARLIMLSLGVTELSSTQAERVAQEARAAIRPPSAAGLRAYVTMRQAPPAVAPPVAPAPAIPAPRR